MPDETANTPRISTWGRCLRLAAWVAGAWLLMAGPAWSWDGASGLAGLSLAATLCLIPGWLVFLFDAKYGTAAPVGVFLTATFGRMVVVLAGALAVKWLVPGLNMTAFAVELGTFYVLTLTVETRLLFKPPRRGPIFDETRTDDSTPTTTGDG